jgi:hypothetical protein
MASRSDEHLSLMPDFSSRFDLDFNQAGPEWGLDPEFLGPSWKVPVNNSENTCPVTGSSGVSRCGSGSTTALHIEQVDDYLDMSMDSADILSDITWQLETGTDFSTTVLKRPTVAHSASREGVTAGSLKTGPYHFPEQSTMPARRPLASRPFSMPFSRSSRSSQLESSVSRSTTNVTSRKVNSIQKRKASAKKFLPMKLIGHLENEFQSNLTVSREFKRKSSEILGQLKKLIDNEKLHGSSGASMFLSPEEQVDDDQTSTGSTGMGSSSTNLILHMADLDSGFETHLGALAPASMSAQCTQTHNLVSRHAKTKTIYQCTYPKCVKSFISFHDWKRHEEIEKHWLQKRYMCLECDIAIADPENIISCAFCLVSLSSLDDAKLHSLQCQDAKDNNRTFARKDKFRDHLRDEHMIANIQEYMESWTFSIESNWPRRCGFCGAIFKRWEERAAHIEEHYKRGVRITAWKLPFSSGDDSAIENLDAIYENDSDDDEHGYQGQSSLQPYSYHLGGYPGNSSSAARVRGRGNSSASTDKEQQSNHRACGGDNAHQNHQTIDSARDLGCGSGSWSEEEEKHLLQLVNSNPERNWVRISSLIGSQTPKQCRDRYRKFLKPSMTDHPIKTEEAVSLEKWVKNSQILHYGSSQIINGGSFTSCPVRLAYRLVNSRAKSACSGSSENLTKDETRCTEDNKINDSSASPLSGLYQNPAVGLDGLYHCPWEGKDPFCDHKPEHLKSNYLYESSSPSPKAETSLT